MAHWKEHVGDCKKELGNGWDIVHHWLDKYAGNDDFEVWLIHRIYRHNFEGIEEVRKMWGDEAAKAAEIHILKDEGEILSKADIEKKYGVK